MYFGLGRNSRNRGFSLIELSIALTIFLIITAPLITTLKLSADKITAYLDYRKAFNRTSMAIALLKAPVFYCGFGMPVNGERYKDAFGNQRFDPFRWDGPIKSVTGPNSYPNSELRIAYAQPGSTKLAEGSVNFSSTGTVALSNIPAPSELAKVFAGNTTDLRNWVFFGGIMPPSIPLCITGINGKILSVKNNMSAQFSIPQGDRLHLFRAMTAYCKYDCVYTRDYRAPGDQPRVRGIQDMRFDVDLDNRLVTIYILSRGDTLYDPPPPIIGRNSWPEEYIRPWVDKPSKYQLYASKIVWRLPNCIDENIINGKDITEQFL